MLRGEGCESAPVHNKQIPHVVCLAEGVDYRLVRIITHARGPRLMAGEAGGRRVAHNKGGLCSVQDFLSFCLHFVPHSHVIITKTEMDDRDGNSMVIRMRRVYCH